MIRSRTVLLVLAVAAAGLAVKRHLGSAMGHRVEGGILIVDTGLYDGMSRLLLGSFHRGIADDVAAELPSGGRVLEVGCGPGHLALHLAGRGLEVSGLDLDPAMIARARVNTERQARRQHSLPSFMTGDVAALPYPDATFDMVVSTLSLHHWADPSAGMSEIARVLRPGGRALIWDLGPGARLLHGRVPDLAQSLGDAPVRLVDVKPWKWPGGLAPTQRMELIPSSPGV